MTLLPEKILSGQVEAPDLFCGGTPCQAFSVAGLRNSLDDARGNLSLTFVGIANAIDHVRSLRGDSPAIVFWENVPGVLNTKDNAFGCFLGALAGESDPITAPGERWSNAGCVFGPQRTVAWRVLDAQYFGVAQRRRRVFVVASSRDDINPTEILFEFEGVRRDTAPSRKEGKVTPTISSSGTGVSRVGFNCEDEWFIETPVVGALDTECGGKKMNHQTVDSGHIVAARMVAFGEYSIDDTASAMKARDWKDETDLVAQPVAVYENHPSDSRVKELGDVSSTVRARWGTGGGNAPMVSQPAYAIQGSMIGRNDNAGPQGDGINEEVCFTQNTIDRHAVAQPVYSFIQASAQKKSTNSVIEGLSNTLTARAENNNFLGGASMAVRRLTPTECERLQGFPDGYTNIPWRGKVESPDGPRYKALGNSWAVPVVAWIGQRIQNQIK
jgi:DNA (cytosine-5)-methyltransferase 1